VIDADLVFIHGFWSSPATWDRLIRRIEADEDLDGLRVHPFGYESPKVPRPMGTTRIPDYDDIAQSLPAFLQHRCQSDTAIVTHSQGGLILQRYLAWMLDHGRGRELARIKLIVMLACPNEGSEYLGTIRNVAGFGWHPQARDLKVLSGKVLETRQKVVERVIYADGVDNYHCHIPIFVYAGRTDNIVKRETAQSIFPHAESLAGDHSSILDPDAPGHLTFEVIKGHLLEIAGQGAVNSASVAMDETPDGPPPGLEAHASGNAIVFQAGRDQHFHFSDGVSTSTRVDRKTVARSDDSRLKAITKHFTGREDQIQDVKREIYQGQHPDPREIESIFLIHGMPGIGKTVLAGYLAHQFADELRDLVRQAGMRQIVRQVGLPGLDHVGQNPGQVLRQWLNDAYKPEEIPADIEGIAGLWRGYLASQDAFLILLLDDAGGADEVRPFLPGRSGYIVLVTSRRTLPDLIVPTGATPVNLGAMDESAASHLIRKVARRVIDDHDDLAVKGIADFCGYHPLAMTLAVAPLAGNPEISFAERLAELEARPQRLPAIDEYLDGKNDGVAKAFELSYTQLPAACQLLLRRLSLAPLQAISREAAGALSDWSAEQVRPYLRQLEVEAFVSREHDHTHLHDLIREYVKSLAGEDDPVENAAAIGRLLGYYYASAAYVDTMLTRQPPPPPFEPPYPGVGRDQLSRQAAVGWARDELPNLQALTDYVVLQAEGGDAVASHWVVLFASALAGLLRNDGYWLESIDRQTQAVAAAVRLDSPLAEANALHERALLYRLSARLDDAISDLDRALILYRDVGGDAGAIGAAHVLNTYGVVLDQRNRPTEAQERFDQAMVGHRRLGDRLGEANVLHDEGMKEYFAGKRAEREGPPGQALVCYQAAAGLLGQALALFQEVDHPLGQAHARLNLGRAERNAGRESAAAANLDAAGGLYHELGNRLGEATILVELGEMLRRLPEDQYDKQVVRYLRKAERISKRIGNQRVRGTAFEQLGEFYLAKGCRDRAIARFGQALRLYRENGLDRDAELEQRLISLDLLDEVEASDE
jgi:tetratricopeptide (TPR) repeat protein